MVLQWKICETVFKVGLTTVFFYTVLLPYGQKHLPNMYTDNALRASWTHVYV